MTDVPDVEEPVETITSTNALPLGSENRFGAKDDVPSATEQDSPVARVEDPVLAPAEGPLAAEDPNPPTEPTEFSLAVPWDSPPAARAANPPVEWNNAESAANGAGETSEPGEIYESSLAAKVGGWGRWEPVGGKGVPGVSAGW